MRRAAAAAILLAGVLPLRAVTLWTETGARLDETIADTTTAAPATALQPLLTQVPFSSFRYPHVDAEENVTFIADDPAFGSRRHHGIYRSFAATGELQPLVRIGEATVPGTATPLRWLRGLQMEGSDFVFNATDAERKRGLYHWSNGNLRLIARTGTTKLPGVADELNECSLRLTVAGAGALQREHVERRAARAARPAH
jgi:hypothetical protein